MSKRTLLEISKKTCLFLMFLVGLKIFHERWTALARLNEGKRGEMREGEEEENETKNHEMTMFISANLLACSAQRELVEQPTSNNSSGNRCRRPNGDGRTITSPKDEEKEKKFL